MADAEDLRVLVVDDQASMRALARQCLSRIGIKNIVAVSSGEEAMRELVEAKFDVIISDLNMDGMNGIDLLNAVRDHPVLKDTAFVLATSECYKPSDEAARDSKFVAKPFSVAALRDTMGQAMGTEIE